jgi:hypothetical protein
MKAQRGNRVYLYPFFNLGARWAWVTNAMPAFISERAYVCMYVYTECHRRKGQNFGRVFLMLNYIEKPQNTYIRS